MARVIITVNHYRIALKWVINWKAISFALRALLHAPLTNITNGAKNIHVKTGAIMPLLKMWAMKKVINAMRYLIMEIAALIVTASPILKNVNGIKEIKARVNFQILAVTVLLPHVVIPVLIR